MTRGKDLSNLHRGFIVGAQMAGASVTKTAQLAVLGTVTKVTSAFRSIEKTSVNRAANCGRQCTFDDCDARALVRYVRKTRGTTLPRGLRVSLQDVIRLCQQE